MGKGFWQSQGIPRGVEKGPLRDADKDSGCCMYFMFCVVAIVRVLLTLIAAASVHLSRAN